MRQPRVLSFLAISLLVLTTFAEAHGQPLTGDCDENGSVALEELVVCVSIGLGQTPLGRCPALDNDSDNLVTVAELVNAVHASIRSTITANGTCLMPGPQGTASPGLVPCDDGMTVRVSSCSSEDRARCLRDPSALVVLNFGSIGAGGHFTLELEETEAMSSLLVFEAEIDEQTTYRALNFGLLGTGSGRGAGIAVELQVLISPISEASVQLLNENGLENFDDEGAIALIASVEQANAGTDFSGRSPAAGVTLALDTARNNPQVQNTLMMRRTPPPTPTQTPTPTVTPTSTQAPTCTPGSGAGSIAIVENLEVTSENDPVFSLGNASNNFKDGYCFYVSDACAIVDFSFGLPRQGSVEWRASEGGSTMSIEGIELPIPPIPSIPFTGELVCLELDAAGQPLPANSLRAAVTYSGQCQLGATSLEGTELGDGDTILNLGIEYDACPQSIDPTRIETCWSQSMFTFQCN